MNTLVGPLLLELLVRLDEHASWLVLPRVLVLEPEALLDAATNPLVHAIESLVIDQTKVVVHETAIALYQEEHLISDAVHELRQNSISELSNLACHSVSTFLLTRDASVNQSTQLHLACLIAAIGTR